MSLRNIVIYTNTESQLQGLIRGIEALDTEHKIGIIHGTYGKAAVDEVTLILAEVANALIIKTLDVQTTPHPQGKDVKYMDLIIPNVPDMNDIITYIKIEYGNDLIKNIIEI